MMGPEFLFLILTTIRSATIINIIINNLLLWLGRVSGLVGPEVLIHQALKFQSYWLPHVEVEVGYLAVPEPWL